jgi:hypothetical protein
MPSLGSAFLGDVGRHRRISSPPSTPSPTHSRSPSSIMTDVFTAPARQGSVTSPTMASPAAAQSNPPRPPTKLAQPVIEPALSLELRLRLLEALILGARQDAKSGKEKLLETKNGATLIRLAEDVQRRLDAAVDSNEGLKRFMQHCPSVSFLYIFIYSVLMVLQTTSRRTCSRRPLRCPAPCPCPLHHTRT